MNTQHTLFLITCFCLTPFVALQAQTTTATSSEAGGIFESVIQNVTDIKETVQEKIQGEQPGVKAALEKRTQERIINLAANISNRFDGIIARLENISTRLNQRIEKQATEGYDVTAARNSLAASTAALTSAKNRLRNIDEAVLTAVGSTNPREEWKDVRATFLSARDDIRIAHAELKNTVSNLKSAQTQTLEPTPLTNQEQTP